MKIFKELNKLGYKHYTENTIEELDNLPLDSEERIMEQALVLRWFDSSTEYGGFIVPSPKEGLFTWWIQNYTEPQLSIESEESYLTWEEAQDHCLRKLIEIVEEKQKENE